jgi:hypothetical protein
VDTNVAAVKSVADNIYAKVDNEIGDISTMQTNIAARIGASNDTGGTTTSGSVAAKLNKVISDIATFVSNWTSTRAGYIDTIKTNTDRLTSARATIIDNIGATGNTGGSATAGTVMAKLNTLITNTTTNNTASKTGILSAKLAYIISLLENTTYGLNALKTTISGSMSVIPKVTVLEPSDNVLFTVVSGETNTTSSSNLTVGTSYTL